LFRHYANGGLSVYGADIADMFRRAAGYLPVRGRSLVINVKAANALCFTVPPSLLGRANEVIE
jgi:putative ABC transport system substrate-binding protein